jgi:hypothetical protein
VTGIKSKDGVCGWCESTERELRERTITGGSTQYVYQCLSCGQPVSNPVPKSSVKARPRLWDVNLQSRMADDRQRKIDAESLQKRQEWFREHSAYLRSPKWRAKRDAVLDRAKGLCEGCRDARAVHVHHLTYDHWQNELLWELVAVCEPCHERCHEHMQDK